MSKYKFSYTALACIYIFLLFVSIKSAHCLK